MKPERTFTHHKTGLPATMKTDNIGRRDMVAAPESNDPCRRGCPEWGGQGLVAAKLTNVEHGGDRKQGANVRLEVTHAKAAELLNVSERGVDSAKRVIKDGAPELVAAVESGKVSVSAAATIAEAPKDQQREIVARGEREILQAAKEIRTQRLEDRRWSLNIIEISGLDRRERESRPRALMPLKRQQPHSAPLLRVA